MKTKLGKLSVRLSDEDENTLKRLEAEYMRTRSNLTSQAIKLLGQKYPDKQKAAAESPLFPKKKRAKTPKNASKRKDQ